MTRGRIQNQLAHPHAPGRQRRNRFVLAALVSISMGLGAALRHSPIFAEQATSSASAGESELERRLREEAPKAWVAFAEYYRHIRGSFSISTIFVPDNKAAERQESGDIALNGKFVKEIDPIRKQEANLERVLAKNAVYAFSLSRRAGDPHARFAIDHLQKLGDDANVDQRIDFLAGQTEAVVSWPWRINGRTLPEWEKTPPFVVKDVKPVGPKATATVRVDFEGMRLGPDTDPLILSGYVVFDPSDHWVVRKVFTKWPKGGTRDAVFEYARHEDGFPILTKRVEKAGTEKDYAMTTELLDVRHETVPIEEFYLSHYGFPEPDFSAPGRHWLLWLFASAGLGCVLIAGLIWLRRYRAGIGS